MTVRISILTENSAGVNGALAEWGWSVFIETDLHAFLLDTGPGTSAYHNAQLLGIDLRRVEKIVLSHSQFDHTGGLREILRRIGKREIEIVAHPDIWSKRYNRSEEGDMYMGMPFQKEELETYGARFNLIREPCQLLPDVTTCGEIPMNTEFEANSAPASGGKGRYLMDESGWRVDTIADDLSVIINSSEGLIV
jgi:7,8-dihydropterin-6-yl-methyl-4-(beta-D-ribofuranosyl)aminobenzene 5'-phosphate synthase